MARRRDRPPIVVEELSGPEVESVTTLMPDDFDAGIMIPIKVEITRKPVKIITNWRKHIRDEKAKRERAAIEDYVQQRNKAYELIRQTVNPSLPEYPLELKTNQVLTDSELVITVGETKPTPPWRRL